MLDFICRPPLTRFVLFLLCAISIPQARAAEVLVAVAANFTAPMQRIAADFARDTGHSATLSSGATGQFYAQIQNGAPFDVLLAADDETPRKLAAQKRAVADSRFTYATGRLVLWSAQPGLVDNNGAVLKSASWRKLAIAKPQLAPYGQAAMEVLTRQGLVQSINPRLVEASSIGQAYQFVASGNAELGFVALSQVITLSETQHPSPALFKSGSGWLVPTALHSPIRQDAVLLTHGANNPAAKALLQYLKSDRALVTIRAYGYDSSQ